MKKLAKLLKKYPNRFIELSVSHHIINKNTQNNAEVSNILFQCVPDARFMAIIYNIKNDVIRTSSRNVQILITRDINAAIGNTVSAKLKRTKLFNYFYTAQWRTGFNVSKENVLYSRSWKLSSRIKAARTAYKIWIDWKRSKTNGAQKKSINYKNIRIDDLIIDTYLRYKPSPKFDVHDKFTWKVIIDAVEQVDHIKLLLENNPITQYVTTYASYTTHGIPVRVALEHGLDVYSIGNITQFGQKLTKIFPYHSYNPETEISKNTDVDINSANEGKEQAKKILLSRFSGNIDPAIKYMQVTAYNVKTEKENIQQTASTHDLSDAAIVFLHDFYDSPNIYNSFIFDDFWDWATQTFSLLDKHGIKYAVKPHPNQRPESNEVITLLKNDFPKTTFLSHRMSNVDIINARPKIGITVYGTIAGELAFFGIPSICCSDHPHSKFDFATQSKNFAHYESLIKNIDQKHVTSSDKKTINDQAIDYFVDRNSMRQPDKQAMNKIYSQYWHEFGEEKPELLNVRLFEIRQSTYYKNFIKVLSDDIQ